MTVTYPDQFRCAQITPYSAAVDMGVLRTAMEGGGARQRRLYRTMPHSFALEFVMTVPELGDWQAWVNDNGYDYFVMPALESVYSGKLGLIASPHSIRFISNLEIDNPVYGWVRVKVAAELDPLQATLFEPIPPPVPDWIIAGSPASPSVDTITAGAPASPSADTITGGSPVP